MGRRCRAVGFVNDGGSLGGVLVVSLGIVFLCSVLCINLQVVPTLALFAAAVCLRVITAKLLEMFWSSM